MSPRLRPYALWLLPEAQRAALFQQSVAQLAQRYNAPIFEPHITVYGGHTRDLEQTKAHFYALPATPLTLRYAGTFQSERFTQTYGLRLQAPADLAALSRSMADHRANGPNVYQLRPHMSLIYAQLPATSRQSLAEAARFTFDQLVCDRLALVTPGADDDWHGVADWQVQGRRQL